MVYGPPRFPRGQFSASSRQDGIRFLPALIINTPSYAPKPSNTGLDQDAAFSAAWTKSWRG